MARKQTEHWEVRQEREQTEHTDRMERLIAAMMVDADLDIYSAQEYLDESQPDWAECTDQCKALHRTVTTCVERRSVAGHFVTTRCGDAVTARGRCAEHQL